MTLRKGRLALCLPLPLWLPLCGALFQTLFFSFSFSLFCCHYYGAVIYPHVFLFSFIRFHLARHLSVINEPVNGELTLLASKLARRTQKKNTILSRFLLRDSDSMAGSVGGGGEEKEAEKSINLFGIIFGKFVKLCETCDSNWATSSNRRRITVNLIKLFKLISNEWWWWIGNLPESLSLDLSAELSIERTTNLQIDKYNRHQLTQSLKTKLEKIDFIKRFKTEQKRRKSRFKFSERKNRDRRDLGRILFKVI